MLNYEYMILIIIQIITIIICIKFYNIRIYSFNFFFLIFFFLMPSLFFISIFYFPYLFYYSNTILKKTIFLYYSSFMFYLFGYHIANLFFKRIRFNFLPNVSLFTLKKTSYILLSLSFISILLYAIKIGGFSGISSGGNYSETFVAIAGSGYLIVFFPLYILGIVMFFYAQPSTRNFFIAFIIGVFFGILLFIILGGKRRFLFYGLIPLFLIAYKEGYFKITFLRVLFFVIFGVILLNFMGIVRYGKNIHSQSLQDNLFFAIDSLSAWKSFLNIVRYIDLTLDYQYFSLFSNHFLKIIPRFIWEDKPLIIFNSGNFYTQEILNYSTTLTISPTLMGELYLIHGSLSLFIGMFLIGMIIFIIDNYYCQYEKGKIYTIYFIANITAVFALTREGIEVFLFNLLLNYLLLIIVLTIARIKIK